jgi:hypothetical protein
MNPLTGVVGRLGAGAFKAGVSRAPGSRIEFNARLLVTDAQRNLNQFERKTKQAVMRALNEAMRNAFAATVRDVMAEAHIKKRKVLTETERGKKAKGPMQWFKASPAKLSAALFVGLKTEPRLTLARTGAVGGKPAGSTIAKANRQKRTKGKAAEKAAARAVEGSQYANLRSPAPGHPRPYSKLFWAQMRTSGHVGVFARRGPKRLKIDEPFLSIRDVATRRGEQHVNQQFRDTYPRALKRLMGI